MPQTTSVFIHFLQPPAAALPVAAQNVHKCVEQSRYLRPDNQLMEI